MTTNTKISAKEGAIMERFVNLTGLSSSEISSLLFDTGMDFLEHDMDGDDWGIEMLSRHSDGLFWNWWKLVFNRKLASFVNQYENKNYDPQWLARTFRRFLDPQSIEMFPPDYIYKYSYMRMSKQRDYDKTGIQ